VQKGRM